MEHFAIGLSWGLAASTSCFVVRLVVVSIFKAVREAV